MYREEIRLLYLTSVNTDEASAPANHVRDAVKAMSGICAVELWRARNTFLGIKKRLEDFFDQSFYFPPVRGGWRWYERRICRSIDCLKSAPDIIYIRFNPSFKLIKSIARLNSLKILELNGLEVMTHPAFPSMLSGVDLIFVGTDVTRANLLEHFPEYSSRIRVIPNVAVNQDVFFRRSSELARQELELPRSSLLILHVSGFQKHHDFKTLFLSFELFLQSHPDSRLVLAGNGPRLEEVTSLARQFSVFNKILFIGEIKQEALPALISACDVCVNPMTQQKLRECGNLNAQKTYEYVLCEVPAVESFTPELPVPEWAKKYLYCVPAEDPEKLCCAILEAVRSTDNVKSRLREGRDYIRCVRSWDAVSRDALREAFAAVKGELPAV